jgi:hypothetical protein
MRLSATNRSGRRQTVVRFDRLALAQDPALALKLSPAASRVALHKAADGLFVEEIKGGARTTALRRSH